MRFDCFDGRLMAAVETKSVDDGSLSKKAAILIFVLSQAKAWMMDR